jgi:hypothetical protein
VAIAAYVFADAGTQLSKSGLAIARTKETVVPPPMMHIFLHPLQRTGIQLVKTNPRTLERHVPEQVSSAKSHKRATMPNKKNAAVPTTKTTPKARKLKHGNITLVPVTKTNTMCGTSLFW